MWTVEAPLAAEVAVLYRQLMLHFLQLTHEGKCEFMIIPCPSCKERIRFNEQERHNERECPERTLNCKYCKEPFHFKNIKVGHDLFRLAKMLCLSVLVQHITSQQLFVCLLKKHCFFCFFFQGTWWDLSQVPDDLWRLCQEENTQRKGKSVNNTQIRFKLLVAKERLQSHVLLLHSRHRAEHLFLS